MAHYKNLYGDVYETEEDVWDEIHNEMSWDDFEAYFEDKIGFTELFTWARKQPNFFEEFENEFCDAEVNYFDKNYVRVEDEETEEEA